MKNDMDVDLADDPLISVVVPMYNEQESVCLLAERVHRAMDDVCCSYELLFVDDGSTDESAAVVADLAARSPGVRLVSLSRNFGKEAAMLAGYDHARGQAVIVIDADLQQPPELFCEMIGRWRDGYDVVNVVRATTEGISCLRRLCSNVFYWLSTRLCGVQIPAHVVDFRLLDRHVIEILCRCREQHRFNRALVAWAGFRQTSIEYTAAQRHAGQTHWSTLGLLQYALDGILSFSGTPLRLAGLAGGMVSVLSFMYLAFVVGLRLLRPELFGDSFGYASIIGMVSLLGGIQLVAAWVLGEYIGRIFEQVKQRPSYVVRSPRSLHCQRHQRARSSTRQAAIGGFTAQHHQTHQQAADRDPQMVS